MQTPSGHQAAIRPYTPHLMVEQAAQGVEEQSPRACVVAGGKGPYLVPCVGDSRAPEQRVPVIEEVARIAGQRLTDSLPVRPTFTPLALASFMRWKLAIAAPEMIGSSWNHSTSATLSHIAAGVSERRRNSAPVCARVSAMKLRSSNA